MNFNVGGGVKTIVSIISPFGGAFAAIMNSGTDVVCWGNSDSGGDQAQTRFLAIQIFRANFDCSFLFLRPHSH